MRDHRYWPPLALAAAILAAGGGWAAWTLADGGPPPGLAAAVLIPLCVLAVALHMPPAGAAGRRCAWRSTPPSRPSPAPPPGPGSSCPGASRQGTTPSPAISPPWTAPPPFSPPPRPSPPDRRPAHPRRPAGAAPRPRAAPPQAGRQPPLRSGPPAGATPPPPPPAPPRPPARTARQRRPRPLIAWPLEGAALTLAPPRRGKGALIALNLLAPPGRGVGRGFPGATVIIDPRGELWCIAARRRRQLGRRAILLDPFAVVAGHDRAHPGALHLPDTASARYNPLDFIREDDDLAVQDIHVLLDALLTPPPAGAHQNSRHFHDSARAIIAGAIAWVRFTGPENARTLARVHALLSLPPERRESTIEAMRAATGFPAAGLARHAAERQAQVGKEEGGSNYTTIANQLAFLDFPELARHTANSSFDPAMLARGDTDLFVVAPDDLVDRVRAWLRLWIAIPNAIAARHPLERDLTIVVDEMPRLGYLQPMMDAYTMAAGKGVHFWGFAQSLSALDATWGKEARRTLIDLAEVVQILGWPRADAEGADALSRAIGTATFESLTETSSGSLAAATLTDATTRTQAGDSRALVRERLVTPDDLMTLAPDRQYLVAASRDMPRDAVALHHARYWHRPDTRDLADPNPFVIRKLHATEHESGARLEGSTP